MCSVFCMGVGSVTLVACSLRVGRLQICTCAAVVIRRRVDVAGRQCRREGHQFCVICVPFSQWSVSGVIFGNAHSLLAVCSQRRRAITHWLALAASTAAGPSLRAALHVEAVNSRHVISVATSRRQSVAVGRLGFSTPAVQGLHPAPCTLQDSIPGFRDTHHADTDQLGVMCHCYICVLQSPRGQQRIVYIRLSCAAGRCCDLTCTCRDLAIPDCRVPARAL